VTYIVTVIQGKKFATKLGISSDANGSAPELGAAELSHYLSHLHQ